MLQVEAEGVPSLLKGWTDATLWTRGKTIGEKCDA
jgi:hypothetical protein